MEVDVQCTVRMPDGLSEEELMALLGQAVHVACEVAGYGGPPELSLIIADDELVRELNRAYRQVDDTTDVLAFSSREEGTTRFVAPAEAVGAYLGDVIISFPQASRQAEERAVPIEHELCLLTIHGVLHLLGYDHDEPAEQARMWSLQRAALRQLGIESIAPT